jgi:hypothetical protein
MKEEAYTEMDQLIQQVLKEEPEFSLSTDFADRVSRKVGDRMLKRRLITEYALKIGVIVVPLLVLAGIWFFVSPETIQGWLTNPAGEYLPYILLIVLVAFVVFADQVVLRFFLLRRK